MSTMKNLTDKGSRGENAVKNPKPTSYEPKRDDMSINGEADNPAPEHPPAIPWPPAEPPGHKPFKLR